MTGALPSARHRRHGIGRRLRGTWNGRAPTGSRPGHHPGSAPRDDDARTDDLPDAGDFAENEECCRDPNHGHEQRHRRDPARVVASQKGGPQTRTDDGAEDREVGESAQRTQSALGTERGERVEAGGRSLDDEAHRIQRRSGDDGHPQRHPQGVVGTGESAPDVARCPAQTTEHGETDREQSGHAEVAAAHPVDRDDRHAENRDRQAEDLPGGHPFPEEQHAEHDREGRRGLEDQRGEPGRHAQIHGQEQHDELHAAEAGDVQQEPLQAHLREPHEQHDRYRHHRESHCGEEERREVVESESDRDEVQSPEDDDEQREEAITSGHGPIVGVDDVKDNRI